MQCYVIVSDNRSYVGITNNLQRRLRQHNGEIKGGAKATRGKSWSLLCVLSGFPTPRAARQFEWRMHHPPKKGSGLKWRLACLQTVLSLDQWTKTSPRSNDLELFLNWQGECPISLPPWVTLT